VYCPFLGTICTRDYQSFLNTGDTSAGDCDPRSLLAVYAQESSDCESESLPLAFHYLHTCGALGAILSMMKPVAELSFCVSSPGLEALLSPIILEMLDQVYMHMHG
jgi:hypothetical protein